MIPRYLSLSVLAASLKAVTIIGPHTWEVSRVIDVPDMTAVAPELFQSWSAREEVEISRRYRVLVSSPSAKAEGVTTGSLYWNAATSSTTLILNPPFSEGLISQAAITGALALATRPANASWIDGSFPQSCEGLLCLPQTFSYDVPFLITINMQATAGYTFIRRNPTTEPWVRQVYAGAYLNLVGVEDGSWGESVFRDDATIILTEIPEPAAGVLILGGVIGLGIRRGRARRAA